jgi:hypothetical protein
MRSTGLSSSQETSQSICHDWLPSWGVLTLDGSVVLGGGGWLGAWAVDVAALDFEHVVGPSSEEQFDREERALCEVNECIVTISTGCSLPQF